MKKLILPMAIFAYLGYDYYRGMAPSYAQPMNLPSAITNQTDPCLFKPRCVVVYVAPWCPSCALAMPAIEAIRNRSLSSSFGIKVVVGKDERYAIDEYAKKFGPGTYLDYTDSYYKSMKGRSVPSWWMVDDKNKIHSHFTGAFQSDDTDRVAHHILTEKLDMDVKYFRPMSH